jgi:prohibitin 1
MTFGQEFTKAVEQKQIAQQDAERAKFVVEKVRARLEGVRRTLRGEAVLPAHKAMWLRQAGAQH